ncbi:MAG: hypothetical protein ACYDG5_03795 [Dehalococcoidales bacterium]
MRNNEKGQALPLAMMVLAIGTLLIAPFLGHASSSVIGSHTYADAIAYRNACDAGVEHAIWRLVYNDLGTSIPNPGDHITYNLPETLNGVTPSVTVTTNTTSIAGTAGNITAVIDTLEFDTSNGYTPDIVQVSSTVYAIAYRGSSTRGYLETVSIDANGNIGNSVIDTLIFDDTNCYEPSIIQIASNIFAIAYRGNKNDGYVVTTSITASGDIGSAVIDSLDFDPANSYEPDIIQISGNIYAVTYRGSASDGYLKTMTIDVNGAIGSAAISTLKYSTDCYTPSIIQVSGNIYALTYRGKSNIGCLSTVTIDSNGIIGGSVISALTFDSSTCYEPTIIQVTGTIYAIAYRGSNKGNLKTVSISANGIIGSSVIDTLLFDTATSNMPDIIQVASDTFVIAYGSSNNKGYLKTVSIASDGTIGAAPIDTLNFDTSNCYEPSILHISGDVFAVAYRGASGDGFLKTIGITSSTSSGVNVYQIVATAGDTSIQAYVRTGTSTATIRSWQIR